MNPSTENTSVAIVILNWNGVHLLEKFLPSVVLHSKGAKIYVADNASTDHSIAFVETHFPSVKIIRNSENFGFAKGYNEALKSVEEDLYVLVNSDIEVTANWLEPALQRFKNQTKTAIIQPKIRDYKNKAFFEYAGAAGGFLDKYGFPFCRGRIFDTVEKDEGQYDDAVELFWASGACFFIRKIAFWQAEGFDGSFFAHMEEIDLCWRAQNNGHSIWYEPQSVVFHVGGATLSQSNPHKTFLNFRNSLFMLTKNLPAGQLLPVLFFRLALDGMAGLKFLLEGKARFLFAVLQSHASFYCYLLRNLSKRRAAPKKEYFRIKSIVFQYYWKKNRVYSRLD